MFSFFIKKNFADSWDNMFILIISNVFSLILLVGGFFLFRFAGSLNQLVLNLLLIVYGGLFTTLNFAYGANACKIANFENSSIWTFFRAFSYVWKIGFASGCLLTAAILIIRIGIIYYMSLGGIFIALMAVLFWFLLISLMAFQWFIPLYFLQEQNGFKKCLRKSYIIFFDNPVFSMCCFVYNLSLLAVSCFLFLLIPGFSGVVLSTTNALRLRLKKYDWLEEMDKKEPGFSMTSKRKNVPWKELLAEDDEALGPRTWKSFILPWKE